MSDQIFARLKDFLILIRNQTNYICKKLYLHLKYQFCITKLKKLASISLNCMSVQLKKQQQKSIKCTYFKIASNQFLLLFNCTHVEFIEIESHLNSLK